MNVTVPKKSSRKKIVLFSILALVVIAAGVYIYFETLKYGDTKNVKADYTMNALDFIREFSANDSAASKKYTDKIVVLNGTISQLESPDTATINVKFVDTTGDYAIFRFQDQHLKEGKTLKEGETVSIKGAYGGVSYSEILEARSITFIRATLNK